MEKHIKGLTDLAELLKKSPLVGLRDPEQAYSFYLSFDSVESWKAAVKQYGAEVRYHDQQHDGHYGAKVEFGKPDGSPYEFPGVELNFVHVTDAALGDD